MQFQILARPLHVYSRDTNQQAIRTMDLARFHYAINQIAEDFKNTGVLESLKALIQHLNGAANNSGQPQYIDSFRAELENVRNTLELSNLNKPDYETADALELLGLKELAGNELYRSLRKLLDANQLSPQTASTALSSFHQELADRLRQITQVGDAFKDLKVPYEGGRVNDAEIELRLPTSQAAPSLKELAREARDWDKDLSIISEVFDPDRGVVTVRTLASGSWLFYLAATPFVLQGVAKCLQEINRIVGELIKSKRLIHELRKSGQPEELVEPLESHAQSRVKIDLESVADRLVDEFYKGDDPGRRAELKNGLRQTLKRLSKKITEGARVGLRITPPKKPHVEEGTEPSVDQQSQIEESDRIQKIADMVRDDMALLAPMATDESLNRLLPAPDAEDVNLSEL